LDSLADTASFTAYKRQIETSEGRLEIRTTSLLASDHSNIAVCGDTSPNEKRRQTFLQLILPAKPAHQALRSLGITTSRKHLQGYKHGGIRGTLFILSFNSVSANTAAQSHGYRLVPMASYSQFKGSARRLLL